MFFLNICFIGTSKKCRVRCCCWIYLFNFSVYLIVNPTLQIHFGGVVGGRWLLNSGLLVQGYNLIQLLIWADWLLLCAIYSCTSWHSFKVICSGLKDVCFWGMASVTCRKNAWTNNIRAKTPLGCMLHTLVGKRSLMAPPSK